METAPSPPCDSDPTDARHRSARVRVPARIWSPPGHWWVLAFCLLVILVVIAFQGIATHTVGAGTEGSTSAQAPLAGVRPILAARGSRLVSTQPPPGRRIALTFDDGPDPR